MPEYKIVVVKFAPMVGFSAAKTYSYVTDLPEPEKATHAVVIDPRGEPQLVAIVDVEPYQPKAFQMKQIAKLVYRQDILDYHAKPLM